MTDSNFREVVPPLSSRDERVLWEGVERRLDRRRGRLPPPALIAAAAGLAVALGLVWWPRGLREGTPSSGDVLEALEAPRLVELPDGSSVRLLPSARLRIDEVDRGRSRLALVRGRGEFLVAKRPGPTFRVRVDAFEVEVRGTRFSVEISDARVARQVGVTVHEGSVAVRRLEDGREVLLDAGQSWSSLSVAAPSPSASPPRGEAPAADDPPAVAAPEARPTPRAQRGPRPLAGGAGCDSAFLAARRARAAGDPAVAASLFHAARRECRGDPRAALLALELGRIRLNELGDAAGAVEALSEAFARSRSATEREDALGRLVEALDRSGTHARCREARSRYLGLFPTGVHLEAVKRRCGGP
jgi:hypothetical protein